MEPEYDPNIDIDESIGQEPDANDEEVEVEFPEAGDECDVDDNKTSREDGDQ